MIDQNFKLELTYNETVFINAYIEAFYFADTGDFENGQPKSCDELSEELKRSIVVDCLAFYTKRSPWIGENVERAGADFYFTRCGHGVGFWDRPEIYGESEAEILSKACESFGNAEYYTGDDGLIYG